MIGCWQKSYALILFYKVTELFSGTKYPTANLVFPNLYQIKIAIGKWKLSDNDYIKNMATTMMGKFDKYWKDIHGVMTVATVLDPRYKFKLIDYYFPLIYGSDSFNEIQKVRKICSDLEREYRRK